MISDQILNEFPDSENQLFCAFLFPSFFFIDMTFQIGRKAGTYHASFSIYTFSYVFSACLVCLYIETEQHDVSVFYHIVFSLQTDQTLFLWLLCDFRMRSDHHKIQPLHG